MPPSTSGAGGFTPDAQRIDLAQRYYGIHGEGQQQQQQQHNQYGQHGQHGQQGDYAAGHANGYAAGHAAGYAAGHAAGHVAGYAAGNQQSYEQKYQHQPHCHNGQYGEQGGHADRYQQPLGRRRSILNLLNSAPRVAPRVISAATHVESHYQRNSGNPEVQAAMAAHNPFPAPNHDRTGSTLSLDRDRKRGLPPLENPNWDMTPFRSDPDTLTIKQETEIKDEFPETLGQERNRKRIKTEDTTDE